MPGPTTNTVHGEQQVQATGEPAAAADKASATTAVAFHGEPAGGNVSAIDFSASAAPSSDGGCF